MIKCKVKVAVIDNIKKPLWQEMIVRVAKNEICDFFFIVVNSVVCCCCGNDDVMMHHHNHEICDY